MRIGALELDARRLASPVPTYAAQVDAQQWRALAEASADGGRLVALWGEAGETGRAACAAYASAAGLLWIRLPLGEGETYPDVSARFPFAARMERAAADLAGIRAQGLADERPWLDHGAWPQGLVPLQRASGPGGPAGESRAYPFVQVQGDGVHEIAVGPVHAGTIEPGHFRFSVVGEKVLRLEERLGYTHKGIERRFTELEPLAAHRLAGRVSGDSTVGYAWAYCMALESALQAEVPERAEWLRALLLERERVANHLGDLGALGNDAGLAFGLAQFSRLREDWLRLSRELFGHRLMMDCIVPGGVAGDVAAHALERLRAQCDAVERELRALRQIYEEHPGLQDRFINAGRLRPELAATLGLTGLAGRASGQANDLRCAPSWAPYDSLRVRMATHRNGDVAARVTVRFEEAAESLRLIREI